MNSFSDIVQAVRHYSMVSDEGLCFTMTATHDVMARDVEGVIVECGVWKGGASLAMLLFQRNLFGSIRYPVHMMDSFQGLPLVEDRDGPAASRWQRDTHGELFFDNCKASMSEVVNTVRNTFGFSHEQAIIWPGQFSETLPNLLGVIDKIALLRLDCDWYAPIKECLEALGPRLSKGAIVILDDYYAWDGCARAVHEYLAKYDLPYRLRQIGSNANGAFFVVE